MLAMLDGGESMPNSNRWIACRLDDDFNVVSPKGRQVLLLTSVGVLE